MTSIPSFIRRNTKRRFFSRDVGRVCDDKHRRPTQTQSEYEKHPGAIRLLSGQSRWMWHRPASCIIIRSVSVPAALLLLLLASTPPSDPHLLPSAAPTAPELPDISRRRADHFQNDRRQKTNSRLCRDTQRTNTSEKKVRLGKKLFLVCECLLRGRRGAAAFFPLILTLLHCAQSEHMMRRTMKVLYDHASYLLSCH